MPEVRVGVIGVGRMGEVHVQAYCRNLAARVEAVVDTREDRANAIAAAYGGRAFTSVEDMLDQVELDAVSVCTNDELHVAPALAALAAGKHVLLEKPIATTLDDADTITRAAEASGTKFLVGQILRFDPRYAHVKERVAGGDLGELETVFARRLNHVGAQDNLRGRVSVLSFLGVHDFDYVRWLSGSEPARVHTEAVSGVHTANGYDIEDNTFTLIRFHSGVVACVEAGWVLPNAHPRRADFKLEAICTRGVANIDMYSQGIAICTERGWERPSLGHAIDAEVGHFLDCILNDGPPLVTGQDGRAALAMSLAAQESARTGRIVEMAEIA